MRFRALCSATFALLLAANPVAAGVEVTVVATPEADGSEASSCPAAEEGQRLLVFVSPPEGSSISTAVFDIDYDEQRVAIPGFRNQKAAMERVQGFPLGAFTAVNDKDGSVRIVVTGARSLSRKLPLFTVDFDVCQGAKRPELTDYTCTIASCVAMTVPVEGCTCRIEMGSTKP